MAHSYTYDKRAYEDDFAECDVIREAILAMHDRIARAKGRLHDDRAKDELQEMMDALANGLHDSGNCGVVGLNIILDEIESKSESAA